MTTRETSSGTFASSDVSAEISAFLAHEAELLDSRRFAEWIELVDEDFVYQVPVTFTPDNPVSAHYDRDALIIDETRQTLVEHWFRRYEPDMWEVAWSENPPVRFRHFITNVRVRATDDADVFDVRSNALVSATRLANQPNLLPVERFDIFRRTAGGWRLARRFAVPDTAVIEFAQLRVVL